MSTPSLPKILIIDNDGKSRKNLVSYVARLASQLYTANHGQAALIFLEKGFSPDLIFASTKMAVLNGIGFTKRLRANGSRTPIILITDGAPEAIKDELIGCEPFEVLHLLLNVEEHKVKERDIKEHLFPSMKRMLAYSDASRLHEALL